MAHHLLAIDQGTTSTRAMVFDEQARVLAFAQRELLQHYPQAGWVEHDGEDIWRDTLACAREALEGAGLNARQITGIGITNQRETVLIWDRATGEPLHKAIVWQDRRTACVCQALRDEGHEAWISQRTGLLLDPYFSATKAAWILDHVPGARARAEAGELAMGTIDAFLLWRLTGGKIHASDVTNAARTMLFDIHRMAWDEDLCRLLRVPSAMLPEVCDNGAMFGETKASLFGAPIPITGMAGDQQAALFGQACFTPGMVKATYGTGAFLLMNTGATVPVSTHRLLATPAWRLQGKVTYALEGSVFVAGAAIKWLRDGLGVMHHAEESASLASSLDSNHGVYMVPAFVGLGAPHWRSDVRAALVGLSLDSGPAHLVRAALEAAAYQSRDLLEAMAADSGITPASIRLDGGMSGNGWLCQFLADILGIAVARPAYAESTALGAAFHAGLTTSVWSGLEDVSRVWAQRDGFAPAMTAQNRNALLAGWQRALAMVIGEGGDTFR